MKRRIYYYSDVLNDDFATLPIKTILTPANFNYVPTNVFYRFFAFVVYHFVARPLVFIYVKVFFIQHFKNRKVLRKYKGKGYFIYGNHTNATADAFIPSLLSFPKKNYLICHPNATSIKGIKTLVKMLGALPLPSTIQGSKNYLESIKKIIENNKTITIYPEAHIWPYYCDIRPFTTTSFHYPHNLKVPCFTMTNVYIKRKLKWIKKPKMITYIDGPFYADYSLNKKESIQKLRDDVYQSMLKQVHKHPKYEYVKYIYTDKGL